MFMKWLIVISMKARFSYDRMKKREHKYDSIDLCNAALAVSYPLWALQAPIYFFFDFPYENLIFSLGFGIPLFINIIQVFILKRKGVYEEIMNEVDSLPEENLKRYCKKNMIIIVCSAVTFLVALFGLNLWGSIRDGLI